MPPHSRTELVKAGSRSSRAPYETLLGCYNQRRRCSRDDSGRKLQCALQFQRPVTYKAARTAPPDLSQADQKMGPPLRGLRNSYEILIESPVPHLSKRGFNIGCEHGHAGDR